MKVFFYIRVIVTAIHRSYLISRIRILRNINFKSSLSNNGPLDKFKKKKLSEIKLVRESAN